TGVIDGVSVVVLPTARLSATYYDTADLRLTRSGLSLRYRVGTDESGWTLKLPDGPKGPLLVRREIQYEGGPKAVPAAATSMVRAYVRNATLVPVGRLDTVRRRLALRDGILQPLAEIDDDEVSIFEGRRVASRFREIEVELSADGSDALLEAVVDCLQQAGAGAPDPTPKIVRALGERALTPPELTVANVDGDASTRDLVQATIAKGVARLMRHDPGVRLGDDPEDVHQARVATRRLRSDLRTFRRLLDDDWVASVRNELKWVAAELGRVRDADVLSERLSQQASELPAVDAGGAAALLRKLAAERAAALADLAIAMDSPRYVDLVDDLVRAAAEPRLIDKKGAERARDVVPGLVRRPWKHLAESVAAVVEDADDELLHEVRKRAKQCRYAAEAVVPVMGKPAGRLAAAVTGVQEVLGGLQDAVVAENWLRRAAAGGGAGASARAVAAGQLIARQEAEMAAARAGWKSAWKKASAKKLRAWTA
ncbi:MAG: hypothetical protein QOG64_2909, partial [Acidimicrobiaceae bacterium]|nr:hypothetical protein [Acidimicrobiaceae bacterium]